MRRGLVLVATLVTAGILVGSAAAVTPTKTSFSATSSVVMSGVCGFNVNVASTYSGFEIDYFDAGGNLTRIYDHITEQDVFSHGTKTLTSLPYTFNIEVLFDSAGNVTHVYASGVTSTVPLPDGSTFHSAGRADFTNHPGVQFLLSPDQGNPGNVAGFCAALS